MEPNPHTSGRLSVSPSSPCTSAAPSAVSQRGGRRSSTSCLCTRARSTPASKATAARAWTSMAVAVSCRGGVAASRQPSSTATPTASSGSGVPAGASSAGSGWTGTGGARLRLVAVQLAGSILRFSLFFLFCGGFVRSLHVVDSGDVETAHLSIFFCGPATEYDRMIGDICSDIQAVHKHVLADYAETPSCTAI